MKVLQGTILGPLLSIFTTIRSERFTHLFPLYADDCKIYFHITDKSNNERLIEKVYSSVTKRMSNRKLKLNQGKTGVMFVGSDVQLSKLDFGGSVSFESAQIIDPFSGTPRKRCWKWVPK